MEPQKHGPSMFFSNPITARGQPGFIEASPKYLLYFNGSTVFLRSLHKSTSFIINHVANVVAAKFSNDYRLVASIDERATLQIHSVSDTKISQINIFEGFYLGAKRIDWTSDNKKICVVGSGRNRYGRVVSVDTGTDVGDLTGVTAQLTAVSFRPQRPFKLCVAGNQHTIKYYDGPPYKFAGSKKTHTNFVNEVKYCPDGSLIVSVSSDRKIILYDGKTGEVLKQLQKAHEAGILGVAWISNTSFVTVGSDRFMRFWNTNLQAQNAIPASEREEQMKLLDTFLVGISYCKQSEQIYILTLSGQIKEFDKFGKYIQSFEGWRQTPAKILHNNSKYFIVDQGGKIIQLTDDLKDTKRIIKARQCFQKSYRDGCINNNYLFLLSLDNEVHIINIEMLQIVVVKIENGLFLRACDNDSSGFILIGKSSVQVWQEKQGNHFKVGDCKIKWESTACHSDRNLLFLGNIKGSVIVCLINGNEIEVTQQFQNNQNKITYFTTHQDLLFIGQSTGAIRVYQQKQKHKFTKISDTMGSHSSIINSILFIKDKIYTFSNDNSYSIWDSKTFMRKTTMTQVHKLGILSAVKIDQSSFLTSGGDMVVRVHKVQ